MLPTHQVVAVSVHPEEVAGHEGALEVVLHVGADGHTDGSKMRHLDRGAGKKEAVLLNKTYPTDIKTIVNFKKTYKP